MPYISETGIGREGRAEDQLYSQCSGTGLEYSEIQPWLLAAYEDRIVKIVALNRFSFSEVF